MEGVSLLLDSLCSNGQNVHIYAWLFNAHTPGIVATSKQLFHCRWFVVTTASINSVKHNDGLVQDYSNSTALALQSCNKLSIRSDSIWYALIRRVAPIEVAQCLHQRVPTLWCQGDAKVEHNEFHYLSNIVCTTADIVVQLKGDDALKRPSSLVCNLNMYIIISEHCL